MSKLILLVVLFLQGVSLLSCKSLDESTKKSQVMETQKAIVAKKNTNVQYELLSASYYSGNPYAQGIYIARSFEDAISIMEGNDENDELFSKIDFEKKALIFVFAGTFNTGGYAIKVNSIKRTAKNIISAVFSVSSPALDSIVTQAFTHPSIIVSVEASKTDIIKASFK